MKQILGLEHIPQSALVPHSCSKSCFYIWDLYQPQMRPDSPPSGSNHVVHHRSSHVTGRGRRRLTQIALYMLGVETKKHMGKRYWGVAAHKADLTKFKFYPPKHFCFQFFFTRLLRIRSIFLHFYFFKKFKSKIQQIFNSGRPKSAEFCRISEKSDEFFNLEQRCLVCQSQIHLCFK
jgi:hypothetical protein